MNGGGGGGSSFSLASKATSVTHSQGVQAGHGVVELSYPPPPPGVERFAFTGAAQTWTCPSWVTSVEVDMSAAQGAQCTETGSYACGSAGLGGRVVASVAVVPGTTYTIVVGGQGSTSSPYGGYPGGGGCANTNNAASTAGGGGLSLFGPSAGVADAWIVAGAGGGSGNDGGAGGPGGDTTAGAGGGGTYYGGQGGGPTSGGAKATRTDYSGHTDGSQGQGGIGCVK